MTALMDAFALIRDPKGEAVLSRLHHQGDGQNWTLASRFALLLPRLLRGRPLSWSKLEPRLSDMFLAIDPANGALCYMLGRMLRARQIVEFGTSFGVSTIYWPSPCVTTAAVA